RFELVASLLRLFPDLLLLGNDNPQPTRRGEEFKQRNRIRIFVESLAHGYDQHLVGRTRRALCRRLEATQRFDHIAHELQSHRFCITGREYVDDAATNREGTVLLDRILTRKSRIDEQ